MFLLYLCSFLIILGYDLYQPNKVDLYQPSDSHPEPCSNPVAADVQVVVRCVGFAMFLPTVFESAGFCFWQKATAGGLSPINTLNIGSNKRNSTNLSDWISNQVYRLCCDAELFL